MYNYIHQEIHSFYSVLSALFLKRCDESLHHLGVQGEVNSFPSYTIIIQEIFGI